MSERGLIIKDVPGFEGLYGVSTLGDVYSYGPKSNHISDIILKPSEDKVGGFKWKLA